MKRRDFFEKAGIGSAAFVSFPVLAGALATPAFARSARKRGDTPDDPFVILLRGTYRRVKGCPDLGLSLVNICDGSYLKTKIFAVSGLPHDDDDDDAIGTFYVAPGMGKPVAYDLPGGALSMSFTANNLVPVPDGEGGTFLVGTLELDIAEATGVYESFIGGRNKMVDILHRLADGTLVEHCFCIISRS